VTGECRPVQRERRTNESGTRDAGRPLFADTCRVQVDQIAARGERPRPATARGVSEVFTCAKGFQMDARLLGSRHRNRMSSTVLPVLRSNRPPMMIDGALSSRDLTRLTGCSPRSG